MVILGCEVGCATGGARGLGSGTSPRATAAREWPGARGVEAAGPAAPGTMVWENGQLATTTRMPAAVAVLAAARQAAEMGGGAADEKRTSAGQQRQERAAALAAQLRARKAANEAEVAKQSAAEAEQIEALTQRAKEAGKVEKTAGESGQAGTLKRKWERWLASTHGTSVAARLKSDGGAPELDDMKRFSTWTYTTRQRYSCAGRTGVQLMCSHGWSSWSVSCGAKSLVLYETCGES